MSSGDNVSRVIHSIIDSLDHSVSPAGVWT